MKRKKRKAKNYIVQIEPTPTGAYSLRIDTHDLGHYPPDILSRIAHAAIVAYCESPNSGVPLSEPATAYEYTRLAVGRVLGYVVASGLTSDTVRRMAHHTITAYVLAYRSGRVPPIPCPECGAATILAIGGGWVATTCPHCNDDNG